MPTSTLPSKVRGYSLNERPKARGFTPTERPSTDPAPQITVKRQSMYGVTNISSESLCTGYRSCFAPHAILSNNVRTAMKSEVPLFDSNADFDTLPPAIRRKYFSSLERLRYAQNSATTTTTKPPGHFRNLSNGLLGSRMMNISRHHSNESNRNLATPTGAYRDSKHRNAADAFVLSQSDAHWFLELPETIRRKHFSKEERIILANKCESIIVDAADESLYRMGCQKIGRRFSSVSTASDVGSLSELDFSLDKDVQQAREDVRKSFQWMGADQDLDLQLHQFQETDPAPPPPPVQECPLTTITRKRRTLSLSKPRKTHSSQSSILPPAFARNRMSVSSRRNNTPPQSFSPEPPYQRNTHSSESDATYYQDPEARLKLRVYLASPAKFDEAIEFGFPSQTDAHKNFNRPRIPTVRRVHCDFEDSGTETDPELVDDYADTRSIGESVVEDLLEEEEEIDLQPDEMPLPGSSGSNSSTIKAFPIMNTHYPHTRPANREMTLRMTLTRKDLRAYEVTMPTPTTPTSPVHQIMTLEDLPPEKEQLAGAIDWAALDKNADQSGLRKLWKRVTGH